LSENGLKIGDLNIGACTPPTANVPVLIPKQFMDFEKSKKDPFYTQNWKNPKNVFLKAEGVVKLIFSFSLTPPNVPVLIPKQFSDLEKTKKNLKRPLLHQKCIF